MNPEQRKLFVDDQLKKRGKFVELPTPTAEQRICTDALKIFNNVTESTLKPLLKALKTPSQYDSKGTQFLLRQAFEKEFRTFSKDELCVLLALMHAEELEKQAYSMAQAGLIGNFVDKKI
jgi:hypothetical protein